jgi:zinc protease
VTRSVLALLALAVLLLGTVAAPAQIVVEGVTPAGVRFALAPRPTSPVVALSFSWRDGFGEARPGREGLSGLAAAWHAAGPRGVSEAEFREDLRDEGIGLSLGTFNGLTVGSLSAPLDRIETAAERLRTLLLEPALNDTTLARLKRQRRAALAQARETPGTAARTAALTMVAGGSPFVLELVAPARSTVADVSRPDIEAWRAAVLARDNLVVAAAGPIAEPDLIRLVDRIFGELPERASAPERAPVPLRTDRRTIVIERPVAQTTILLAGPTGLDPRDEAGATRAGLAVQILSAGQTSRLFRAVRVELGATYGTSADLVSVGGTAQILLISTAVDHALAPKALATLRAQYERFHRDGVSEVEVAPVRARLANALEDGFGRVDVAGRLRAAMAAGREPAGVAAQPARVSAVTAAEINALITERFPAPPLATVIVAPSAEGYEADCVVSRGQAVEVCLGG